MRRVLKGLGVALGGLAVLALGALAYVYVASELTLGRTYDVPLSPVAVPTDSAAVAEGRRLAAVLGCYDGCHGEGRDGGLVAPNLTRVAADHTDAELGRVIRHGVRRDGTSTWGMPSASFYHLSDEDLGAILAFLRSAPLSEGPATDVRVGPLGRLGVVLGEFPPQAAAIDHDAPRLGARGPSDRVAFGRYLAVTACSECHGMDLRGGPWGRPRTSWPPWPTPRAPSSG